MAEYEKRCGGCGALTAQEDAEGEVARLREQLREIRHEAAQVGYALPYKLSEAIGGLSSGGLSSGPPSVRKIWVWTAAEPRHEASEVEVDRETDAVAGLAFDTVEERDRAFESLGAGPVTDARIGPVCDHESCLAWHCSAGTSPRGRR